VKIRPARGVLEQKKDHDGHAKPMTYQVSGRNTLKFTITRRVVATQVETQADATRSRMSSDRASQR